MTVDLLMSVVFVAAIIALLLETLIPIFEHIRDKKRRKK